MRALLVTVLVALALPAVASAHATLRSTTPGFGAELQHGPATIRLLVRPARQACLPGAVHGPERRRARLRRRRARAGEPMLVANVRPLKIGTYTVRWRAISADSHVVSGVWTFGVGVPAPPV